MKEVRVIKKIKASMLAFTSAFLVSSTTASSDREQSVSHTSKTSTTSVEEETLKAVVRQLCHKKLVLLGESPSHGAGHTIAFKAKLTDTLISKCGFGGVAFESSRYEFFSLKHALREQRATSEMLGTAVGAIWRYDEEMDSLIGSLYQRAAAGKLQLFGLDAQIGGLGEVYTNKMMIEELTASLEPATAMACKSRFSRHVNWSYPPNHSYGRLEHDALLDCVRDMRAAPNRNADLIARDEQDSMLDNLFWMLSADLGSPDDKKVARENWLYWNLEAAMGELGTSGKLIVWGASTHFAKRSQVSGNRIVFTSLGTRVRQRYGDHAASIGFSARSGTIRRFRTLLQLPVCSEPSLETSADGEAKFVSGHALKRIGFVTSHALDDSCQQLNWSEVFDGIVVFNSEWPARNRLYATR